ncbi:hypothetical protein CY652_06585 [Burkholderia sp. WAC0059]|uniref:DUF2917 domain-containing protein n=1 Tax=Burkholderia sp. WAC0059 TaxID=2066022 RepID=UPI000C7F153F|nr:DUF2917 domain-containing protein [Burkholderia sp. WAC0059]PLZ03466.1 hypothetical protein CY652_06585 [Burkholderia sp. WAC0059]
MQEISSDVTFAIDAGETVSVRVASSTRLVVEHGTVWLTRSGDTADYWLMPGHALRLRRGERLWVGAEDGRAARVVFRIPLTRAGRRALDALVRLAGRLGLPVGEGWCSV